MTGFLRCYPLWQRLIELSYSFVDNSKTVIDYCMCQQVRLLTRPDNNGNSIFLKVPKVRSYCNIDIYMRKIKTEISNERTFSCKL